jgi:hypothetical protein
MSKSKRIARGSYLHFALGACLLTAPLGAGCSNSPGVDTDIKIVDGPTIQESTKGKPRWKSKKEDRAAPKQNQSGRPR